MYLDNAEPPVGASSATNAAPFLTVTVLPGASVTIAPLTLTF